MSCTLAYLGIASQLLRAGQVLRYLYKVVVQRADPANGLLCKTLDSGEIDAGGNFTKVCLKVLPISLRHQLLVVNLHGFMLCVKLVFRYVLLLVWRLPPALLAQVRPKILKSSVLQPGRIAGKRYVHERSKQGQR